MALGRLEPHFINAAMVKENKKKKKMVGQKNIKYEGPIAACLKRGHSSTPKNAATTLKNAASEPFYGPAYEM